MYIPLSHYLIVAIRPFQSGEAYYKNLPKPHIPHYPQLYSFLCDDQAIFSLLVVSHQLTMAHGSLSNPKHPDTSHSLVTTLCDNPYLIPGKSQSPTPTAKLPAPQFPTPHNLHLPHFRQVLFLLRPLSSSSIPSPIHSFGPPSHTLHMSLPPPPLPTPSSPPMPCPCPVALPIPSSRTDSSTQQKLVKSCTHLRYCSSRNSIVSGFGQLLNMVSEVGSRSMASYDLKRTRWWEMSRHSSSMSMCSCAP